MRPTVFLAVLLLLLGGCTTTGNSDNFHSENFSLPKGFQIDLYAENIKGARSLALGAAGTLFVGTRKSDRVYALVDENRDFRIDRIYVIAKNLNMPNGVAFRDGALYVAEVDRILRFDDIEKRLANPPQPVVINDSFPDEKHHGWKFIAFGPDGKLYVPVGAPCNICESSDDRFATITRMPPDGSRVEIYAHGVRNSVGFD